MSSLGVDVASSAGSPSSSVEELVLALHSIHAICLNGPYRLKSGLESPFYIDLRLIVSHPSLLRRVSQAMYDLVRARHFDVICGVPYTALPIATLMADQHDTPMVMRRKEVKSYGLKKCIEGVWQAGQTCLVVEDLVTSGLSVFETIQPLVECGLQVKDVVVLINREQGGRENIEARGLALHAVVTITQVMEILQRHGRVTSGIVRRVKEFVRQSQVEIKSPEPSSSPLPSPRHRLSYRDRIPHCKNAAARALLRIVDAKRSNLCLSADVTTKAELLRLADQAGPHICMLKTHMDILSDFDPSVPAALLALAQRHDFLLFEDRKFADIGSTVAAQYAGGVYRIADWSHVVNAHVIAGPGIIAGLKQAVARQLAEANAHADDATTSAPPPRGLLLIAEMSSEGALATGAYTEANVRMAEADPEFVFGFICQHALSSCPGMLHLSPGVQLPTTTTTTAPDHAAATPSGASSSCLPTRTGTDALGQQYHSPRDLLVTNGTDLLIVGRAILKAKDVAAECRRYQTAGWQAYEQSLQAAADAKAAAEQNV